MPSISKRACMNRRRPRLLKMYVSATSSFPALFFFPCSLQCIAAAIERVSARPRAIFARATNMASILLALLVFSSLSQSHSLSVVKTVPIVSTTIFPNTAVAYNTFTSIITATSTQEEVNIVTFGLFTVMRTSEQEQVVTETSTIVAKSQETGVTTSIATIGLSTVYKTMKTSSAAGHAPSAISQPTAHTYTRSTSSSTIISTTGAAEATAASSSQSTSTGLSSKSKAAIAIAAIVLPVFLVGLAFWIAMVWRRRKEAAARRAQYDTEGRTTTGGAIIGPATGIGRAEQIAAGRMTNTPDSQIRLWDEKDDGSVMSAFHPHPGVRPLEMLASTAFQAPLIPAEPVNEPGDSGIVRSISRSTQASVGITALPRIPRVAMTAMPKWDLGG